MGIFDLSDRPRKKRPASNAGRRWEETGRKEHKRRAKRVRAQGRGIQRRSSRPSAINGLPRRLKHAVLSLWILASATLGEAMASPHPGGAVLHVSASVEGSIRAGARSSCFWIEASERETAWTAISCRKSETTLSLPMNNPAVPHAERRLADDTATHSRRPLSGASAPARCRVDEGRDKDERALKDVLIGLRQPEKCDSAQDFGQ